MMTTALDPQWFFMATFTGNHTMTFYADNKILAFDHARHMVLGMSLDVLKVTRLKHAKDVSRAEYDAAGILYTASGSIYYN